MWSGIHPEDSCFSWLKPITQDSWPRTRQKQKIHPIKQKSWDGLLNLNLWDQQINMGIKKKETKMKQKETKKFLFFKMVHTVHTSIWFRSGCIQIYLLITSVNNMYTLWCIVEAHTHHIKSELAASIDATTTLKEFNKYPSCTEFSRPCRMSV